MGIEPTSEAWEASAVPCTRRVPRLGELAGFYAFRF
jgi:hypothetical protein